MKITSAITSERQGGIPLPTLQAVKDALSAYSMGYTKDSNATKQQLVADGGGMIAAMLPLVQQSPSSFVRQLCEHVEEAIDARGRYFRHFDYDGVGTFFKTSVEVERLEDASFLLRLSAAYVGNKVEEGIAGFLGVQRGLWRTTVDLTLDAREGERFAVDFDQIATRLEDSVFQPAYGWIMAQIIAQGRKEKYSSIVTEPGIVTLMGDDFGYTERANEIDRHLTVTLGFDTISVGQYYEQPFVAEGPVAYGRLREDWEDPTKFLDPVLSINIAGNEETEESSRLPVLVPETQARMRELAADIQARFTT